MNNEQIIKDLQELFSMLICYRHNLHMMHWKTYGPDFDTVHKLLDDYVDKFNTFVDEIAEMLLSLGGNPLTLQEVIELVTMSDRKILYSASSDNYTADNVYHSIRIMFEELYYRYSDISKNCEFGECVSKMDEHKYWLRIESRYKNIRRLL